MDETTLPLKANKLSLVARTREYLHGRIEDGTYQPGDQLPSENELAAQLGISRPTLREALLNLEQDGALVRRHGVGTFVAPHYERRLEGGLEQLESVLELATRQGLDVQADTLQVQHEPANEDLAEKLRLTPGTRVTSVRRVIVVDGKPVAYMLDVAPTDVLNPADVDDTFNGSVLDLLRKKPELNVVQAVANIMAVNAGPFLAKKLQVQQQQALLLLEETLRDDEGNVLEYSRNYFVPEYFQFHILRR